MTIHNFFIFAGYALWLYLLIYIRILLSSAGWNRRKIEKKQRQIEKFFAPQSAFRPDRRTLTRFQNDARNDLLFDCMCSCYIRRTEHCLPAEKVCLEAFMSAVFLSKMEHTDPKETLTYCLILRNLQLCRICPDKTAGMLPESFQEAGAEQLMQTLSAAGRQISLTR